MFNNSPKAAPDLVAFAAICSEAAERHGDDWAAVEKHIKDRIEELPLEQREKLAAEFARVLGFRASDDGFKTQ